MIWQFRFHGQLLRLDKNLNIVYQTERLNFFNNILNFSHIRNTDSNTQSNSVLKCTLSSFEDDHLDAKIY